MYIHVYYSFNPNMYPTVSTRTLYPESPVHVLLSLSSLILANIPPCDPLPSLRCFCSCQTPLPLDLSRLINCADLQGTDSLCKGCNTKTRPTPSLHPYASPPPLYFPLLLSCRPAYSRLKTCTEHLVLSFPLFLQYRILCTMFIVQCLSIYPQKYRNSNLELTQFSWFVLSDNIFYNPAVLVWYIPRYICKPVQSSWNFLI